MPFHLQGITANHTVCMFMRRYNNQEGVDVRPHDYGGMNGIASLDPSSPWLTATYLPLIKALKAAGYAERETLWGAPYDWRLAADGLEARGAADDMQSLIEMAYATAGERPVVLVAHSMVRPWPATTLLLAFVSAVALLYVHAAMQSALCSICASSAALSITHMYAEREHFKLLHPCAHSA